MPDYKEMYLLLLRATDKAMRLNDEAKEILVFAQQKAEEMYLEVEENK